MEHLDLLPIAYYPFVWYKENRLMIESRGHKDKFLEEWRLIQEAVARMNFPGEFVTFLGYEWHGNRKRYGNHNVYYLEDYMPLDASETLPQLYENLRENKGMAIPHHTAYQVGERGKDWDYHDDNLSPFVEIYSAHGSSEGCDTPFTLNKNMDMGPRAPGGTVLDGLERGYRLGITASGDNHADFAGVWGNGLMAVYAEELTRESIWDAFMNRRVYGVTGNRIKLKFTINGHVMGECFMYRGPAEVEAEIVGSPPPSLVTVNICYLAVLHNLHLVDSVLPVQRRCVHAKLRIECGWGPQERFGVKSPPRRWRMSIEVVDGRLVSVEPCFTGFGQKIVSVSENLCNWIFTTMPKSIQGVIFELESPLKGRINIEVDNCRILRFTMEDLLRRGAVIALKEEAVEIITRLFGLHLEDVKNPDIYWHHAWKIKIHKAVPREAYRVKLRFTDDKLRRGRNYYYLRVTQVNGQMAWSSPIWIDRNA